MRLRWLWADWQKSAAMNACAYGLFEQIANIKSCLFWIWMCGLTYTSSHVRWFWIYMFIAWHNLARLRFAAAPNSMAIGYVLWLHNGLWTVSCHLWPVDCGLRGVNCELRTVTYDLWTVDCSPWAVNFGLCTMDHGLWILDYGWWIMASGLLELDLWCALRQGRLGPRALCLSLRTMLWR